VILLKNCFHLKTIWEILPIAKSGNCPELLATVKKYNYASKRVMEKCSGELVRETDERWYYRLG
jgi:predicted acetyltransferase